jgi:ADP-heptose:LPS heptosyltransferase
VPYQTGLHEAEQSLRLVSAVAGRRLESPPFRLFPAVPFDLPKGAIAIHPGAGAEVKLWQEESWAAVAADLSREAPLVFTAGSPDEVAMAERISGRFGACIVSGLSLPELASFYASCRLVLGPDNGPLHVARAVGTPTVTLFGPTDDRLFGPPADDPNHVVLRLPWRCTPCGRLDYNPAELPYHLCVKLIEPEEVLVAARRVLMARASKPS